MATARMRKYHNYYKGQVNVPGKEPDEIKKEEAKIYEGNMNAWEFLCLHLTGTLFSLVIQQENDSKGAWNSILKSIIQRHLVMRICWKQLSHGRIASETKIMIRMIGSLNYTCSTRYSRTLRVLMKKTSLR